MKYQKQRKTRKKESFYENAKNYAVSFKRYTEAAMGVIFLTGTLSYACWRGINFYNSYKAPATSEVIQSTATAKSDSYHKPAAKTASTTANSDDYRKTLDELLIEQIKHTNKMNETLLKVVLADRTEKTENAKYEVSASTESKTDGTEKEPEPNFGEIAKWENNTIVLSPIPINQENAKWVYKKLLVPGYKHVIKPAYNHTIKPIISAFKKKDKKDAGAEAKPSIEKILKDSPKREFKDEEVTDLLARA